MAKHSQVVARLLARHGTTYAEEAQIRLANKPSPLYRLLVLATLLSARISAGIAVSAGRELSRAGMRTPASMRDASWQERVDALGRGGYRRYDERTATMLGDAAERLLDSYRGDLRRLHEKASDRDQVMNRLQEFPGIGPTGAAIFCREVQGVWTDVAPFVDERAARGARSLGLPTTPARLAAYVDDRDMPHLVAGCVRASLDSSIVDDVRTA